MFLDVGTYRAPPTAFRQEHVVHVDSGDREALIFSASLYLAEGLSRSGGALVIATPENRTSFERQLESLGIDCASASHDQRLVFQDAAECLAQFMQDGAPDWKQFEAVAGGLIRELRTRCSDTGLRIYGDMVGLLWASGQRVAAVRLEKFWNRLRINLPFKLFCSCPADVLHDEPESSDAFSLLCAHTNLLASRK